MIDYREVSMAGASLLQLVDDGKRRKALDNFLVQQAPLVEEAMRAQIEDLIDEINAQLPAPYGLRLVHEDHFDFPELTGVEEGSDA